MRMVRMIPINNDIKFTMGFSSKESINFKQAIMYGVLCPLPSKSWASAAGGSWSGGEIEGVFLQGQVFSSQNLTRAGAEGGEASTDT